MRHTPYTSNTKNTSRHQQGIALFVVIIFVMLSMLLALWASRTAIFNEMVVGNDADYQRAFEAAQSLIQDAELDIQRLDEEGYRPDDKDALAALLNDNIQIFADSRNDEPFCKEGLCVKRQGRQDFWNNTSVETAPEFSLDQMTAENIGATYGQFTGAAHSDNIRDGWYWIEVLNYADPDSVGGSGLIVEDDPDVAPPTDLLDLRLKPSVVYRITALARGIKSNSTAVIQQTYARTRLQD